MEISKVLIVDDRSTRQSSVVKLEELEAAVVIDSGGMQYGSQEYSILLILSKLASIYVMNSDRVSLFSLPVAILMIIKRKTLIVPSQNRKPFPTVP